MILYRRHHDKMPLSPSSRRVDEHSHRPFFFVKKITFSVKSTWWQISIYFSQALTLPLSSRAKSRDLLFNAFRSLNFASLRSRWQLHYLPISHIQIAAACPTFSDAFAHCIGINTVWSTSPNVSSQTHSTSFQTINAICPDRSTFPSSLAHSVNSAATSTYHSSRNTCNASLLFQYWRIATDCSAPSELFWTFALSSGWGV